MTEQQTNSPFLVRCYGCGMTFDAMQATFCSCITKNRTLLCPTCLQCFCSAPASYIRAFWASAPDEIWRRRTALREKPSVTEGDASDPQRPLILVVDDDEDIQTVALHVLSSFGYEVVLAKDGAEGLKRAQNLKPALVLTDALLPRMDGRELCLRLKRDAETATVPVVVMTAVYRSGRYRAEAIREFGADDFVVKPLDVTNLRETLARFIDGRNG